jgi:hypothetical protein
MNAINPVGIDNLKELVTMLEQAQHLEPYPEDSEEACEF